MHALRKSESVSRELAMGHQKSGLPKSGSEGLIDFVISESLGVASEVVFLRGDGKRGKGFRGLPRRNVDYCFPGPKRGSGTRL